MSEEKTPSDVITVKEFFGMTAQEAVKELKTLPAEDRQKLAEGIRNGSLTY